MSVRRLFSSNFAFSINFIIRREVNYLTFIYIFQFMHEDTRQRGLLFDFPPPDRGVFILNSAQYQL